MSKANPEQLKAIKHQGGVLLSAGAGSGKTFVLVEHVTFLVNTIIEQTWHKGELEFTKELKKRFSTIVLMTFTKKATGELAIRLKNKMQTLANENGERNPWQLAVKYLDYLTVTTIHGFCLKLIRQGHFIHAPENLEIISDNEQGQKVKELYLKWLDSVLKQHNDRNLIERFLRREKEILTSYQEIFADAALRLTWKNLDISSFDLKQVDQILMDLLEDLPFREIYTKQLDWSSLEKFKDKDWYIYVQEFERMLPRDFNLAALKTISDFKNKMGKHPNQPRNGGIDEFKEYFQLMKELFVFIEKKAPDFLLYDEHFESHVLPLFKLYQELFNYIDTHYYDEPGLVFSDLETLVYEGLKNPETGRKIGEVYNYFIVDEFQDTSRIQFSILEKIIQGDYSKLFCVGDLKQAIYGFRGGELGVFQDLTKQIPLSLKLTNNYRSKPSIINFNNSVFEYLFQKGFKFEGLERNRIEVEAQTIPDENLELDQGKLQKILLDFSPTVDDKGKIVKLSNAEMNHKESLGIVQYLKSLRDHGDEKTVAILYRKLAPVTGLIRLLMAENLSFTAQVKIPFLHDPVIGIFKTLIEGELEEKSITHRLSSFMIKAYLNILNKKVTDEEVIHFIHKFSRNRQLMGLQTAFWQILFDLGLANSNYQNNLKAIKGMIEFNGNDLAKIWSSLDQLNEDNYSIDFQFGDRPNSILIMTAHASKGLEFPYVILAGIHTNGKERPDTAYLGKNPGSFKWKFELKKSSEYKTPQFFHEKYISDHKNFAESKRLFYVAATRAQEHLIWFDFNGHPEVCKEVANSWIIGLRQFEANTTEKITLINEMISSSLKTIALKEGVQEFVTNPPHFFHQDPLGLSAKTKTNELLIVTDLSVTRLASLAECPRKFYLKNICKISDDEAKLFSEQVIKKVIGADSEDENNQAKLMQEEQQLEEIVPFTDGAMNRGTFIHQTLSTMIKRNWIVPRGFEQAKDLKAVEWVTQELLKFREKYNYISEEPIKFPVFGHMISGTPDLILVPKIKNDLVRVWDFKTGKRKPTHEINYWFQLYLYAYASFELALTDKNEPIELTLAYVDEKELVSRSFSFQEISNLIKATWLKLDHLDEVNRDHCDRCPYQNLCF